MDTLGIDEDGSPVIIEYKRSVNENVITQGLFYLDWLMDHRGEFELLVLKWLGKAAADGIDWHYPRLVCIAGDFTKYDEHAVAQINRNISLIRYKRFPSDLLMFELVHATAVAAKADGSQTSVPTPKPLGGGPDKTFMDIISNATPEIRDWYEQLRTYTLALGDDVQEKHVKLYVAFKRIKNFACITGGNKKLQMYLRLAPATVPLEKDFTRDVTKIGHWAAGDLEVTIASSDDVTRAQALIQRAYADG